MTSRTRHPAAAPALINRRSLLQAGGCAALMPLMAAARGAWLPQPGTPTSRDAPSRILFDRVLFDRHQPAAVAFGRAAQVAGLPAEPIGTDLTALWNELSLRWRQRPTALAGLTSEPVGLYLQLLAQDAGMRLVLRASHTPLRDGRIRHYLTGPRATLQQTALLDAPERWPIGALALLRRCPAELSSKATLEHISPSCVGATLRERLVSWVLAPVARDRNAQRV